MQEYFNIWKNLRYRTVIKNGPLICTFSSGPYLGLWKITQHLTKLGFTEEREREARVSQKRTGDDR